MDSYVFPFGLIEKDCKIILYGCGNVGKQFYYQLQQTKYCTVNGWIDKSLERYQDVNRPFLRIENIDEIEYDFIVIAVEKSETMDEIKKILVNNRVSEEKIIWSNRYKLPMVEFPYNQELFYRDGSFYFDLIESFVNKRQKFGEGQFYQSFPRLGITGQRSTQERIEIYGLKNFLDGTMDVLDIGCNCGFLDLQVADMVRSIVGIEFEEELIDIANKTKEHLNILNCEFFCADFNRWTSENKWDVIFAFSIMCWLELKPEQMVNRLVDLLKPGGYIVLESHDIRSLERLCDYDGCIDELKRVGAIVIKRGSVKDDKRIQREFMVVKMPL